MGKAYAHFGTVEERKRWVREVEDKAYAHFGTTRQEVEQLEDQVYRRDIEEAVRRAVEEEKVEKSKQLKKEVKDKRGKGGVKIKLKSVEREQVEEGVTLRSVDREEPASGSAGSAGEGIRLKSQEEVTAEDTESKLNEIERLTEDNLRDLEDAKSINLNILLGQLSVKYDEALTAEKEQRRNVKEEIKKLEILEKEREVTAQEFGKVRNEVRDLERQACKRRQDWEDVKRQRPRGS